ncbi:Poly(3-hydroxybutyrate) depolymerase [Chryseobacterium nakagawai]|uniref:Phospholipase n=1 Tax=Chryseobacterium nakagawai TaxID=1241982 RepID=A0AAD0YQT6_CHRNA|nr:phospholipase [Chryseobacterium nakagawai]AZA93432.1 phospholipase [Chryseobacterium nakagawai]VEH20111.1 Poly(3-hydroxybutyrate) depolymerase [Chryseobacterium nakagawai]
MQKQISQLLLITLSLIATTTLSFGQKKEFRDDKVDSLTFLNNRKVVNSLNTESFQKKIFLKDKITIPYRLLQPKNNTIGKKYPLVITFHNSTRIGNDNENQLEPLAKIWLRDEISSKYPCYVIAPQFSRRSSNYGNTLGNIQIAKPSDEAIEVLELIKNVEKEYPDIDKNRIYLIGYSMGASTAQNLMSLEPRQFAALVSVAAVPDFSNLKKINKKNMWLIHGEMDKENPYSGSAELFNNLPSNPNLIFTTFTNLNHNNITIPFLLTEEIPKWLFEKSR